MRPTRVEAWAIAVYDRIRSGQSSEDSRVEIKREWISPRKAARRLAGHANAARGEDILWLIGIDHEAGALHPIERDDLAIWLPQVRKEFQGPAPECTDVVVHADDGEFLALLFSTDQAPYVVRIRRQEGSDAGPATREVPWREGTAVRTATHSDLLRLLVPISTLPEVELVNGSLEAGVYLPGAGRDVMPQSGMRCSWRADLTLFVTPRSRDSVIFPIHRCSLTVDEPRCLGSAEFRLLDRRVDHAGRLIGVEEDYLVDRPRRLSIAGVYECHSFSMPASAATMKLVLRPAGFDREISQLWDLALRDRQEGEAISYRVVGPTT